MSIYIVIYIEWVRVKNLSQKILVYELNLIQTIPDPFLVLTHEISKTFINTLATKRILIDLSLVLLFNSKVIIYIRYSY